MRVRTNLRSAQGSRRVEPPAAACPSSRPPFGVPERTTAVSDKSPRQSKTAKTTKSIKEKRADKRARSAPESGAASNATARR